MDSGMRKCVQQLVDSDVSDVPRCVLRPFFRACDYNTFERSFEFILSSYVGKTLEPNTLPEIRERIQHIWDQMYAEGIVDCLSDKMPEYELVIESDVLVFGWRDEEKRG